MLVQQKRRGHERHGGGMAKHVFQPWQDGVDNYNSTFNPLGARFCQKYPSTCMMYICQPLQTSSGL